MGETGERKNKLGMIGIIDKERYPEEEEGGIKEGEMTGKRGRLENIICRRDGIL